MGCLRVLVWLAPLGFVIAVTFFGVGAPLARLGRMSGWVTLGAIVLLVAGLGVFDGILSRKVPKIEGNPDPKRLALHAGLFVVIQVVAVPTALFGLVYAACALL
ncbi:MAG: hypothetical protein HKN82_08280 [Akkermansiaceae bacterium]|nr:hypothetical protein [Akkermansiaceae bacterium]NNM30798.1 hypothetical protein [Akkermansiaceae bacterium]